MKRLIFIIGIFLFALCAGVIYASPQSLDDGVKIELIQSDFDFSIDTEFDGLEINSSAEQSPGLTSNYDGIPIHETNINLKSKEDAEFDDFQRKALISKTEGLFRQVQWKMYISKNLGCLMKH